MFVRREESNVMRYRRFGRTGWNVSEIGYGMWGMAGWTGSEDKESLGSLQRAIDLGCNFFDTAWAYGNGHSEELLGGILRANENSASPGGPDKKLYVATKVPPKNRSWPARPEFSLDDSYPPDYIFEYVDKSLENIGVDTLDLMQLHTWEDTWLGDKRILPAIEKLRSSGKVRAVGLSLNRWEPANGIRAVRTGLIDAVQVIYNIFDQNPEDELFPASARKMLPSSPVCPLTKARSPARSRSTAPGPRATGAALTSSRKISKPASSEPAPSSRFCLTA